MAIRAHVFSAGPSNGILPVPMALVLVFLFVANTLDTGGAIGLKYVSYLPAALLAAAGLWRVRFDMTVTVLALFLFLAYPSFSLFLGIATGAEPALAASQVTAFLPAVVLALLLRQLEDGDPRPFRIFCWSACALGGVVIVLFSLFVFLPVRAPVAQLMDALSSSPRFGYFGFRALGELEIPSTYFRATLFLVPAFTYFLLTGRKTGAFVSFLGLVLSFSRAGILLCLALSVIYGLARRKFGFLILLGTGVAAALLLLPDVGRHVMEVFSLQSHTTKIRVRHFDSLLTLFDDNPLSLLFGQGAGAEFFTTGEGANVSNIEIDHFNMIRKFGLAWFLPFMALFVHTSARLVRSGTPEKRAVGVSLCAMFLAAGTNPVFGNPLFFLAFVAALHASGETRERPG